MAKCMVKLNEFDISYHSRSSMKAPVLANFLVECTWSHDKLEELPAEQLDTGMT